MNEQTRFTIRTALIVALGGFLMGFDASVISGVVGFIEPQFDLSKIELGWSVASLALTSTFAMMVAGPLSDRFGRRTLLKVAAVIFSVSAIASALAANYAILVAARMLGGLGVGAALIIAPLYIAEISPARMRGRMVSLNQLNIVIGISVAFLSNYLILKLGQSGDSWTNALKFDEWNWRWMLGLETLPALVYFASLHLVPESPRWLAMHDKETEALAIMTKSCGARQARQDLQAVRDSLARSLVMEAGKAKNLLAELFKPSMRLVVTIAVSVAILQQITGINSVFFYAPMIFEQSGISTDAAFLQAVLVGLINLIFTVFAILFIDRFGRKPLLGFGVAGIAICMFILAHGFDAASYRLTHDSIDALPAQIDREPLYALVGETYDSDVGFKSAVAAVAGAKVLREFEPALVTAAISINPTLILIGVLGFVASFAISIGPVMWVLFSELFPNRIRGVAISFAGLINSAVSFLVQLVFPWELATIGNAATFFIYGLFAVVGLLVVMKVLPETKGQSLEQLEVLLVKA